jgi:FkbM family methyltransferase
MIDKLLQPIKKRVKSVLRRAGFEISRYTIENSRVLRAGARLKVANVDLVLDVGANIGQFALELREAGYKKRIISFEPLHAAYLNLLKNSNKDPMWDIAPRCGLGSRSCMATINVSGNSWSSSFLPITSKHTMAAPSSAYIATEKVEIFTLDGLMLKEVCKARSPYLKIDTQGYEWEVLEGAKQVLNYLCGIQLEVSLLPLYEGQPELLKILDKIQELGFEIYDIEPEFYDKQKSRLMQLNVIFMKKENNK